MESIQSVIIIVLQLLIGKFIKSNPKLANGIIFWVNWGVGTIANVLAPHLVAPANAGSLSGTILTITNNPFLMGLLQSILATGVHSTSKNLWQTLKGIK